MLNSSTNLLELNTLVVLDAVTADLETPTAAVIADLPDAMAVAEPATGAAAPLLGATTEELAAETEETADAAEAPDKEAP